MQHHQLVVIQGGEIGTVYPLVKPITKIGRATECDIRLSAGAVSRVHSIIDLEEGSGDDARLPNAIILDQGSRNGTRINGRRVTRQVLVADDEIQIGLTVLAFDPTYAIRRATDRERTVVIFTTDEKSGGSITAAITPDDAQEAIQSGDPESTADVYARLEAVYTVAQMIARILEPKELSAKVVELVSALLRADRTLLLLPQPGEDTLAPAAAFAPDIAGLAPATISKTVIRHVLGERKGVLSVNTPEDARFDASKSLSRGDVYALMCVPLVVDKDVLGVLYADTTNPLREFTSDDLALMTAIGSQVAIALYNSNRFVESRNEARNLRKQLHESTAIVGETQTLKEVMHQVEKVAPTDTTVMIRGETGTGKELIARAIHERSPRVTGPFISINCAAMTETLLESELFGHEKGAFTGAFREKPGKFELADGGSLFLDEVGEMSMATQTKLLRVLQERAIDRVGGIKLIPVDVRIIAATNRDLEREIIERRFREDLYYRLSVVPITLPPLRARTADIPLLAKHFLERFNHQIGRRIRFVEDEALACLKAYAWPGNIRELANTIERIVVLSEKDTVGLDDIPPAIRDAAGAAAPGATASGDSPVAVDVADLSLPSAIARLERAYIQAALAEAGGTKIKAAELLGISRPTLDKKLKDFGLQP